MLSKNTKPKRKKCQHCGEPFNQRNSFQVTCSAFCAIEYTKDPDNRKKVIEKAQKDDRRETKAKLRRLGRSDRSKAEKAAQTAFNKFIRERDKDLPCISCGRHHEGQYHAGHYKTRGAHKELALNELNCHKQCAPCNNHLSGNLVNYRINLIEKIGLDKVEWLEGPHEPKKYTVDELWNIERQYKQKLKELQSG